MRRCLLLFNLFLLNWVFALAQITVSGKVTDPDGMSLPGSSIVVKGTTTGVVTDIDGNYSLNVPSNAVLIFSFAGMEQQEIAVNGRNSINVTLQSTVLEELVVTGLGVSREKKALGYAVTEVSGEDISRVKQENIVNSLSGKVAGVQIKQNNNFGGSTNIIIRGNSSIFGGNQPLFVIDGVPISGSSLNSAGQRNARASYDYGNALNDINADDIANISVLKGAAATAIYGSRGANGVVMITTKKGKTTTVSEKQRKSFGVSINSGINIGKIDKETFAEYQSEYGAGYGPYYGPNESGYFDEYDVNGDNVPDLVVPTYEDASYGAKFEGQLVYQWDSFVPETESYSNPNFLKPYPYRAASNTPVDLFEKEIGITNSVDVYGGDENGNFRLGYSNNYLDGILPNSRLNKNAISFNGNYRINEKLLAGVGANLSFQNTTGRNTTGYSGNLMSQFRQWWQVNVDIKEQKRVYKQTGKNYTWNSTAAKDGNPLKPQYWDNPYWDRYENYESDTRDRIIGNVFLTYDIVDWLKGTFRVSLDSYKTLREERKAVGSTPGEFGISAAGTLVGPRIEESSGYYRSDIDFEEINYDLLFEINKNLTEDISLTGLVGGNIRSQRLDRIDASTLGGLVKPKLYALSNSKNVPNTPIEILEKEKTYSLFVQASLGYKGFIFLEATDRHDWTSTLPSDNNDYNYYSFTGSTLFSHLLDNVEWLNYGKFRASYAEVGNDPPPLSVHDVFDRGANFASTSRFSYPNTKNNPNLKPERTNEWETGLELKGLNSRIGFDVTLYHRTTKDMLLPVELSKATGYSFRWVNAAKVQNKGIEIILYGTPIKKDNFTWDINLNWTKNKNKVKDLYQDVQNIVLNRYQGGVTINATKGEPLGTIRGTGFVYNTDGNRVVNSDGYYMAHADQIIGDQNPDWTGGISNTLNYKGIILNFLIDIQQGGDIYSLDMHYGQGTGLYPHTAGLNELGNPIRDPVVQGGGVLNDGVKLVNPSEELVFNDQGQITNATEPNDIRAEANDSSGAFFWGNSSRNPGQLTVYDASYVKLREASISYQLPQKYVEKFAQRVTLSIVGRNLWIIHKDVPHADPESGLSDGLSQGYLVGSYPTVRSFGFNIKVDF